jgi:hypothetical protein
MAPRPAARGPAAHMLRAGPAAHRLRAGPAAGGAVPRFFSFAKEADARRGWADARRKTYHLSS